MKTIQLTSRKHPGKVAFVDDRDYKRVSKLKWSYRAPHHWSFQEYAQASTKIKDKRTMILLHRYILGDKAKGKIVDHINRNGLDCQRHNMRFTTKQGNAANCGKRSTNTSGYKGVCWDKRVSKWKAKIWVMKKTHNIGYYNTPEAAAHAYDEAAKKYFGGFAGLNFPI